ncbi:helix-turn-helix domain-containing protein [Streptomyces sp. NPDC085946]|uniref:helix-turn-helix domain-containing protein n=1 Tax=Streptomyces sp. NPDC085946 TaxID=3365744 RepID=UPI0037D786A2
MAKVRIIECTNPTELYRHYDGQYEPQGAYIELDTQNETLLATYNSEIGNAIPFTVYHGLDRRYSIPILTADAANRIMHEIAPLADRIIAGTEAVWDGNNTVAELTDDARAAEEEIEKLLGCGYYSNQDPPFEDEDLVGVWDIDGAVNGQEASEYGITADTTDARLEEIEQDILSNLKACGSYPVVVCPGLDDYLKQLRDGLADEDPLTAAEVRIAREYLGLTGDKLAEKLGVNPRTLRSWEQGRDPVPGRIRPEIAELKAATDAAVAKLVAGLEDADDDTLITYRNDDEYKAGVRGTSWSEGWHGWSASWHRQVCARAAAQTGARIDYADIEDTADENAE